MSDPRQLQARFGPFLIDEAEARLVREGRVVEMTPKAFVLLCTLVHRSGQLVPKDALLDAVWGHRHVSESVLKNTVSQLRQALGDLANEPSFIETVPRRGYRFVAAVEQGGAPTPETAAKGMTPGAARTETPLLIGREAALTRLQSTLGAALSGQRQLVFVAGEAGIGKTTLVERFVVSLPKGQTFAFGQCVEHYGGGEAYMPVLEALNTICRAEGGAAVVEAMRRVAPTWLLQLPWFVGDDDRLRLQHESAGATQDRMLREFGELIDHVTAKQPLLLVLEDLHWCDHATVQLLGYLARRRRASALMLVGTFRPTELILGEHPLSGLRQELRLHRMCEEIDLESFSEAELGDWLAGRLGASVPEPFVVALHAHTSGLPLFVANVVDELLASGTLKRTALGWQFPGTDGLRVPRSIAGVIEKQITRLSAEQQRVLCAASVGGVEFLHLPLAEVLQATEPELQALLNDIALRLPWLRSDGAQTLADGRIAARYAFGHALCRHVLYERLPVAQKLHWHRQWAAALMNVHGATAEIAAELALHFERGDAPEQAAAQLAIVGARAIARSAPHEALHAARRGLSLQEGRTQRTHAGEAALELELELELRVLEAVALTRLHVFSEPQVAAAFERTRALNGTENSVRCRALHGRWWVHFARGELAAARALATEMLALAGQDSNPALQLVSLNAMGMVLMTDGDLAGANLHLAGALEIYDTRAAEWSPTHFVQDPGVEAAGALAMVTWSAGEPQRARALAERAVKLGVANRHPLSEVTALYAAASLHAMAREFETVRALVERLSGVISEHALPEVPGCFSWLHGRALVALGRIDEGLAEMLTAQRSALDLGMRVGLDEFYFHYAQACREARRHDEALASVNTGLAMAETSGQKLFLSAMYRERALALAERGDEAAATAALRQAVEVARRQGARFQELVALATAQRMASAAADPTRLCELVMAYDGEACPIVVAARDLVD